MKKTIIFLMMFLISLNCVLAGDLRSRCISCWDNNDTSIAIDFCGNNTLDLTGSVILIPNCMGGTCIQYNGTGYFNTSSFKPPPANTNWTLSINLNTTNTATPEYPFFMGTWVGDENTALQIAHYVHSTNGITILTLGDTLSNVAIIPPDEDHHLIFAWDDDNDSITLYIDGRKNYTGQIDDTIAIGTDDLFLGINDDMIQNYDGLLGVTALFDTHLTDDGCNIGDVCGGDIETLWNSGNRLACNAMVVVTDTTPPTINYTLPVNTSIVNINPVNFLINVTDDSANALVCELRNESTQLAINGSVAQNAPTTLKYTTLANQVSSNIFNITCFDNTAANNSASLFLNVSVDRLNPLLDINFPANNSVFDKTFTNITYDIDCGDNNPFLLNFTLFNSSNDNVFSVQNSTPGESDINLSGVIDIRSIDTGSYTANISCSDTHTINKISNYDYVKDLSKNMLYFDTGDNIINITMISKPKSFTLNELYIKKYPDKYGFSFISDKGTPRSTYRFLLSTKQKLIFLKNSEYDAHFISGKNWIDFENNDNLAEYYMYKINDNTYRITIITDDLNFLSIGGLNIVARTLNLNITETVFTSLSAVKINITNFNFADSSFVKFGVIEFNTSVPNTELLLLNSFNVLKTSVPGQANDIYINYTTDENISLTEIVRSVSSTNEEGSTGSSFFNFTSTSAGTHNVTLEIRRTALGTININDIDFTLIKFISSQNNSIFNSQIKDGFITSTSSFSQNLNFSVIKGVSSNTAFLSKSTINASGAGTYDEKIENLDDNTTSPLIQRYMSSSTDTGSASNTYIKLDEELTHNHSINSRMSANEAFTNISILHFDLKDNRSNIIRGNSSSNLLTNDTNSLTLTAGIHNIVNHTISIRNGTSIVIFASISFSSTSGSQTPSFFVNVSRGKCSKKERFLEDNTDVGNVYIYTLCNGLTTGTSYNVAFYANVSTGETLVISDESLSCIESTEFNIALGNTAPVVIITNPANNTDVNRTDTIDFSVSDFQNDDYLVNVSLENTSITQITSNMVKGNNSFSINYSIFTLREYNLTVLAFENETNPQLSGSQTFVINNIEPVINVTLIAPVNNTIQRRGSTTMSFSTNYISTCSLFVNSTLNQTINFTPGVVSFPTIVLPNGSYLWNVSCVTLTDDIRGNSEIFVININVVSTFLSLLTCPTTTAGMFALWLIVLISLFFIGIGFMFKLGIMGFFGSIMLMVSSWYISPCEGFFAFVVALFSFVLMIWFVTQGLGFSNTTFKGR